MERRIGTWEMALTGGPPPVECAEMNVWQRTC